MKVLLFSHLPLLHQPGFSLAGAGGGGFGTLLMREPADKEKVKRALAKCPGLEDSVDGCNPQSGWQCWHCWCMLQDAYVCEATLDHVGMELINGSET